MQHIAFYVPPEKFEALLANVKQQGVDLIGPIALGGRFLSAYFYDPNGIRLELATNRLPNPGGIVESVPRARRRRAKNCPRCSTILQQSSPGSTACR